MAFSTFHPFSRLPVELRLQIWQNACLLNLYGIQYITLDRDGQLALPSCYGQEGDSQASRNRSAYLQNAGLWTACKESRLVITKAWNIPKWRRAQEWAEMEFRNVAESYREGGERFYTSEAPAMVEIPGGYEPWHVTIRPGRDIFCITTDDHWEQWVRDWQWPSLTANFLGNKDYATMPINRIALEYSPSWNDIVHSGRYEQHPSGLGFLVQILYHLSKEDWTVTPVCLIDKTSRWKPRPGKPQPVFCDSDYEYVEVSWNGWRYSHEIMEDSPIYDFIEELESDMRCDLDQDYVSDISWTGSPLEVPDLNILQTFITILVRRDNQVTN